MKEIKFFNKSAAFLRPALLVYFLIPYFFLFYYYKFTTEIDLLELFWAIKNSLLQSLVSAAVVVILSVPMSQGLFLLSPKFQNIFKRLLMIPQILPALFSILIAFTLFNPFPMGSEGIIILFIVVNLGFCTLLTYSATQERMGNLSLVSEIYSLGRMKFLSKIYFPLLRRDLITHFFIVFLFCLSSFSIPLMAGAGRGTNLEVLIYEKIFIEQKWSVAFSLSLLQAILIFIFSYFVFNNKAKPTDSFVSGNYLKFAPGLGLISLYLLFYVGGYARGLFSARSHLPFLWEYIAELGSVTWFTTKALFVYLVFNILLLGLWLQDFLLNKKFNLAINLISVSTVLVGFVFYLVFPNSREYDLIKITLGMSILFFPGLFKFFLQNSIEKLNKQIRVAQIYNLPKLQIIIEIILRQIIKPLYLWLSFIIILFIGEFALLRAMGVQNQTLGLLTQGFLSSYRLPLAYLMSLYLLIYWLIALFITYYLAKVFYVLYKKFNY